MSIRLVRESSTTPNITNKDDVKMIRYAYGGYNGVLKGFGNEINHTVTDGGFKINDGRIVVDGWEVDIDGAGWSIDVSNVIGVQYHSVYVEVNAEIETTEIKSSFSSITYPDVSTGDDLTSIPNGTARLLLYSFKVENGVVSEVTKHVKNILYSDSKTINGNDVELKDGVFVSPENQFKVVQQRLVWEGNFQSATTVPIEIKEGRSYRLEFLYGDVSIYGQIKGSNGTITDIPGTFVYNTSTIPVGMVITFIRCSIQENRLIFNSATEVTITGNTVTESLTAPNIFLKKVYEII